MRASKDAAEGKVKEGKAIIDQISLKNDKLEGEKDAITKRYNEEITKYSRITKDFKELQRNYDELKKQFDHL